MSSPPKEVSKVLMNHQQKELNISARDLIASLYIANSMPNGTNGFCRKVPLSASVSPEIGELQPPPRRLTGSPRMACARTVAWTPEEGAGMAVRGQLTSN